MRCRVVSVNVGLPRQVRYQGRTVRTGIFKEPVTGRIGVSAAGLAGDGQGDLVVHGGAGRAVNAYAAENLWFWRACQGVDELAPGWFGENLTLAGFPMADAKLPSPSRSIPCCGPTRSAPCSTSPRPQASPYPPPAASAPAAPAGSRSKMAA